MDIKDLMIVFLLFLTSGLLGWVLLLDSRMEQWKGYAKRIEREFGLTRRASDNECEHEWVNLTPPHSGTVCHLCGEIQKSV